MSDDNLVICVNKPRGVLLPPVLPPDQNDQKDFDASVVTKLKEEQDGLMLSPGQNSVTPGYWDFCQQNPAVKIWLKAGVLQNQGPGVAVPMVVQWDEIPLEQARNLIGEIGDVEQLNQIKDDTKKKKIVSLCNARIKEVLKENEAKNR